MDILSVTLRYLGLKISIMSKFQKIYPVVFLSAVEYTVCLETTTEALLPPDLSHAVNLKKAHLCYYLFLEQPQSFQY